MVESIDDAKKFYSNYICSICQDISWKPVITDCTHIFCFKCLKTWYDQQELDAKSYPYQYSCPTCKTVHYSNRLHLLSKKEANNYRRLGTIIIKCKQSSECQWVGEYSEAENHIQKHCNYFRIRCQDCQERIYRKDAKAHINECPDRTIQCRKCKISIKFKEQQYHFDHHCPRVKIICKLWKDTDYSNEKIHGGCDRRIRRSAMYRHRLNCQHTIHPCDKQCVGCRFEGTKTSLVRHMIEAKEAHYAL